MEAVNYILMTWIAFSLAVAAVSHAIFRRDSLKVCDRTSYNSSLQCCCDLVLHNIPTRDCQCCGTDGYRWNQTKPNGCTRPCGEELYHPLTQLCCEGRLYNSTDKRKICCGTKLIDTRSDVCCRLGNTSIPLDKKCYRCCQGVFPYHFPTMRCDRKSGVTSLRGRQHFRPQTLCERSLPVFDLTWPPPLPYGDSSYTHIRAIPESCNISVKKEPTSQGFTRITIPLSSFAIVGRHDEEHHHHSHLECLTSSQTMILVVKVSQHRVGCATEQQLQQYLQGEVLDLWAKKKRVVCGGRGPVLRLKEGHNAVLYRAGAASILVKKSLHRP
ncbi:hypothetical protein ACOMHN_040469 [Nucella lapillus]